MSGKQKLQRFAEMKTMTNVIEPDWDQAFNDRFSGKGKWQEHFGNTNPVTLELGCGKGEYTVGMARAYPDRNFIGIDIKGARMWKGAKTALDESLDNVAFLRTRIDFITSFFAPKEVSEIWITFPDPQPEDRREKKRLTYPRFLDRYASVLQPGGLIHLKTDNLPLHQYTKEIIEQEEHELLNSTADVYADLGQFSLEMQQTLNIKTYYERRFLEQGMKITYLKFKLVER